MELTIIEALGSIGGCALLAVLIFLMYRRDRKSSEKRHLDAWKASEERLSKIIEADQKSREENTKATTELVILLEKMNGKS